MSGAGDEASQPETFSEIADRLDEIVRQVRDKSVSLERSLDLFDEAIALGSKAIDMVDTAEVTGEERAAAERGSTPGGEQPPAGGAAAEDEDGKEGR